MDEDELVEQIRSDVQSDDVPSDEAPAAAREPAAPRQSERGPLIPVWAKIGAVFLLLGSGVAFLLSGTGASDAFVYSKLVDEVMRAPDTFVGRELRVEGQLRQGSVRFVDEPTCEHTFVLTRRGHEMPVRYPRCVVPDTFRDDMPMDVVVQGQLQANGTFLAAQVIPRCPSKYEMDQRRQNGEAIPHSAPPERS